MSQQNVERVIGRLATDEQFRRRFRGDRKAALDELVAGGLALTRCELAALSALDAGALGRFADAVDPRLQKCDLHAALAQHFSNAHEDRS
jgi:hypothetical protein